MPILKFNNNNKPALSEEILENLQMNLLDMVFPIGSTYITQTNTKPADENILGFGTWERLKGKLCLGLDEDDADLNQIGKIGGAKTHQHLLPIAIDNQTDNWNTLQWNNSFGYGYREITSPNINNVNHTPVAQSETLYQLKTENTSNVQPFEVAGYMWIRRT